MVRMTTRPDLMQRAREWLNAHAPPDRISLPSLTAPSLAALLAAVEREAIERYAVVDRYSGKTYGGDLVIRFGRIGFLRIASRDPDAFAARVKQWLPTVCINGLGIDYVVEKPGRWTVRALAAPETPSDATAAERICDLSPDDAEFGMSDHCRPAPETPRSGE